MVTRRRLGWVCAGAVGLVLALVLGAAIALRVQYSGTPSPAARSQGRDALWMGHAWVDGRRDQSDLRDMARRLRGSGIRDAYVHVGPLADDGTLDPALHPEVRDFLRGFRAAVPGVRVSAWLGNIVGPDALDLTRPSTRREVAASADRVLRLGFDGVHYDLEPLPDGNAGFLDLLDRTRALTERRGGVLSVAAEQLEPAPRLSDIAGLVRPHFWSVNYMAAVASRVDQVAVMSYDTGLPLESLYGGYVARQTRLALDAVPPGVDLLMGLPAFHDNTVLRFASAETVPAAVRGVRLGYSERPRERFGVALYVDFAATERDWRAYSRGWVRPEGT